MQTISQYKKEINKLISLVPENKLHDIELFIRFILHETKLPETGQKKEESVKEPIDDFFSICGIWQNKDIDIDSIRHKAWRK